MDAGSKPAYEEKHESTEKCLSSKLPNVLSNVHKI